MRKFYLKTAREMNVNNRNSVKKRLQFLLAPLLFFVAIAFTTNLTAQTAAQYSFSASAGVYTAISGDPILIDNGNSDDGFANGFPIGFDFTFGGVTYNEFNVSTNGWITLGNNGDNNINNSGLTNNFAAIPKTPLIAALWDDNEVSDIERDITFKSAGGVLTIQFANIQWRYLASIPEAAINFQIKLYETTGAIEFVYDPIDGGVLNTPSASIGIATASGVYLSVNGTGTAPTASSTTSTNNLSTLPARGQTYTFNPPPPCTGTPAPGRTFASVNSVCASSGATVNLSFETFALGTTFQWEQSINGGSTWSNVPGLGTNSTYVATPTATTQYRCRVTCTSSGASGNSLFATVLYDNTCIVMPENGDITTCSATFYDAGGPTANYSASEVRQLTINPSTSGANVKVVFNSFNTESGFDGLMIYNGRDVNPANLISSGLAAGFNATTAPAGSFYGSTSPGTITSTDPTGSLTFVFRSDNIIQSTGWNATVSCILPCDATPTPGATLATSAFVCNGFSTTLSLTNNNFAGVTYQWQSSVDNGSWSDIAGATSATFTATPTSNVFFRCKVTCTAASAVPGFSTSIQIETSACDEVLMPSDGSLLPVNTCSALFTDGGGTRANYINNSNGTVTFRPATAGTKIRATFTSFSTENNFDGLMIYNGNSTGSPLLSSGLPAGFNATTAPAGSYYGNTSPGVVSSTAADGSLTFVFKSDGTQVSSGWVATISCYVDNSCTTTPTPGNTLATNTTVCYGGTTTLSTSNTINQTGILYQWQSSPNGLAWSDITGATSTTYVVSSLNASTFYRATVRCIAAGATTSTQIRVLVDSTCINMPTSATLATCNASFYDNGGLSTDYTENQNRTFTITPETAGSANGPFSRVIFSTFTLDPSDTLKVYDGNSIAAPLLGAYTTNPGTITSSNTTNGGLTFVFKSNATLNAAGWAGNISCYTPPTCNTAPPLGAVLASIDTVCSGGSTNLSLSNAATLPGGLSYQWKSSSDGITYNNIAGASSIPTFSPTNLTATTWYQCVVTCSGFGTTTFTSVKVLVTPTPVLTVSSATNVCGSGAVLLTASSSVSGSVIRWFSNAAGTTLVGTGTTFTTPVISTNTTYYVKANYGDCESNLIPIVAIINAFPSNVVITPQADTVCVQPNIDSLRTTGGLFPDGSQAQITWTPITHLFRDAAATIPYTLGTNAPTVYIKSNAPNGTIIDYIATAGTTCTKLDTSRITYRDITPSVTIARTRPTGDLCPSDTITFRATSVNGGNATFPASFKFFVNDVAVTANYSTTDTIRFPGALTSIRLSDADVVKCVMLVNPLVINCARSNQFVSNSVEVPIFPVNRDSVLLSASSTSICTGTNVTFIASPYAFPGEFPEYEFLVNGSVVRSRSEDNTYATSSLTNGQVVTVRMYSSEPCVIPVPAVSLPITMTVTPFTPISVALNSSVGVTSCVGTNVTYSAVPSTYTPTSTYQFFVNNVSVQGPNTDSTYAYIPVNGDQIRVVFNSNFSACLTGNPATSNIITMTVSSSTVASVTLTPTTAICSGVSKTFTANPTGGGTSPLYEFFVDGSSVQGPSTTATYSRTATANYNIEVRMTPDGCGLPNPATATLTQVVNPTPQGSIAGNTFCTGGTGQLTFTATSGTGPYTLVVNGVTYNSIASGTPFNASVNPTTTTVYTLTSVTDANGCNRATGFTNASATITVNTPPVVTITNNSSGATVLTCTQTQILLAVSPSGAGFSVLWSNGSTNASQTITTPATYSVTVTQNSTSCSTTSANVVITQNANEPTGAGLLGTYFIPSGGASCRNFASIKNAIDTLNKFGILGNVIINVAAGYTETLTRRLDLGSTTLNPQTALGRTITFTKNGAGANPIITTGATSYVGTKLPTDQTLDGMWSLSGVDNVMIDGIDLVDANTTTTATTLMEYGYGLFKGYSTTTATANTSTTTITVASTSGIAVGSSVSVISGTGSFAPTTIVSSITNATSFVVSIAPTTIQPNAVIAFSTANDGAQNNTIKNCVITLNKANNTSGTIPVLTGSVGIASYNSIVNVATTALIPTTIDGGNSRNKFYTNTISNCSIGIGLSGYTGTNAGRDTLNDVGGASLATGNTITNFGGAGLVNEVNGIRLRGQFNVNASYNSINNNNGGTANPSGGVVRGIYGESGVNADSTIISNNTITINNGSLQNAIGIDNLIGNGISNGNGVNISNNTITGTNGSQTAGNFYGINNTAAVANLNMSNNTVQNVTMSGAGEWRGIYNGIGCTNVTMNGNTIQNNTLANTGSSLTTYNMYSAITALTSITANFNNNQILSNTISRSVIGTAIQIYMIGFPGTTGCNVVMNNNSISDNTINNTGTGTLETAGFFLSGASTYSLDNNTISNIGINVNGPSTVVMTVSGIRSNNASTSEVFTNNIINQLYIKGSSTSSALNVINGILTNSGLSTKTFTNNNINTLYTNAGFSASITALRNNTGINVNFSKNKIYGLYPGQSAAGGSIAKGISLASLSANGVANIFNNFISIDFTTGVPAGASGTAINTGAINTDGIRGIELSSTQGSACSANIYNNSIRLAGTGTTFFASSGIFQPNLAVGFMTLTLRGNIISNQCTSVGNGIVAAFKRNNVSLTNYSNTSNYNSFFAGTASATNLLYYDGTNSEQTIAGLRTRLGAESGSISVLPTFVAPATGDLHITPCAGSNSSFENAVVGTPLVATDYDGDSRVDPSDIGADEISSGAGKVNADSSVCSGSNGATLTLTGSVGVTSITRWEQSVNGGTSWTTIVNTATTYPYLNLTQTTLFRAIVNTASCSNVSSGAATITVNSAPSITTQPSIVAQSTCLNIAYATPTVSVATSASSPTYQWFSNATNSNAGGTLIASATAASYTLPNTVVGTTYYYCIVTSGVCPSTSDVSAAMTVNPLPTITLTDNLADSVCFSTSAQSSILEFSGTTNNANQYSITWNALPLNGFANVTLATLPTSPINIAVPASTNASNTYTGNISVRNSTTGCSSASTTPFTIKVKSLINANNPPLTAQTTCLNSAFTITSLSVSSSSPSPTYQWFSNTTNSNVGGTNLGSANGAQTATYSPQSNVVSTLYYYAVITSNGCSATTNPSGLWSVTTGPTSGALSGTYFIPTTVLNDCKVFGTIAAAVTYLNTNGISQSVIFKVAAGYTETLSSTLALGSASLNNTTSTKTIRFEKNGAGANPLITAYTGGTATSASTTPDGIWSLRGVDYVTIDGIDIRENASNTTAASQMEYGYGLFKLSATDGAQFDTIKNCTITLNKNNTTLSTNFFNGATGIAMTNATAIAANTLLTPTNVTGANSSNTFTSNTISNVNVGIGLIGFAANDQASFADVNNLVGDTITSSKGNSITNLGGGTTANNTEVSTGVLLKNQLNALVGFNTITGADHAEDQYGVRSDNTTGTGSIVIKQNNISITGAGDRKYAGIENNTGGGASSVINITNNTLNVKIPNGVTTTVAASVTGIRNGSTLTPATINISNNSFKNSTIAGAGRWIGIYNTTNTNSATTGIITMNNNNISENNILATGSFNGLQTDASIYGTQTISGDTITNNSKTISGVAELSWLSQKPSSIGNCGTLNIQNNSIQNNDVLVASSNASAVNVYGVYSGGSKSGAVLSFSANTIRKISLRDINSNNIGKLWGLFTNSNLGANPTETIADNKISNLFISAAGGSSATHTIAGLQLGGVTSTTTVRNVFQNRIDSLYVRNNNDATAYNSTVTGIYIPAGTGITSMYTNRVAHLVPFGTSGIARGFWLGTSPTSSTPVSIYNNMIELDMTQAFDGASATSLNNVDAVRGIDITGGASGTPYNISFNTIRIGGTGGSSFGTSVVDMNINNPTYTFRNNVFVNKATPGASGIVAILRASANQLTANTKYSSSSSNNAYFAGTVASSNYLYYDGSNNFQTLSSLQPTREANSIENTDPLFARSADNQDSLHMNGTSNCVFNGTGIDVSGISTDIDGTTRLSPPDMGADEYNTTGGGIGQWAGVNTNWNDGVNWCGAVPTANTDVTIPNGRSNYPIISSSNPVANTKNLTIANAASVTISSGGKLNIYGNISSPGTGRLNATLGTIEMVGSSAQTIPANLFASDNLRNLVINNSSVTLAGQLNLLNKLSFIGSSRTFATGSFLTLKSTDTLTASVADITNGGNSTGNTITGNVSVERFISNVKNSTPTLKAWRLLSMPTTHNLQTIKQSWQENGDSTTVFNPNPGFGAQIITRLGGTNVAARALGFDSYNANGGSLKTFNIGSQVWEDVSTTNAAFDAQKPYVLFIRGSRAKTLFTDVPDVTVMRERGALNLGDFTISNLPTAANKFASIVNPYASAIRLPATRNGFKPSYYFYDPRIGVNGGWITILEDGTSAYNGGSYTNGNFNIQSAQGFFMETNSANPTMTIKETDKVDGSASVQRENRNQKKFYTRLYKVQNGTADLYDGVLNRFDESYNNEVDDYDATKFTNTTENFAIAKNDKLISIESRKALTENDTIFYKMNQMRVANYRFEFLPENIESFNVQAYLEDKYTNTLTPVSLSERTTFDFAISNNIGAFASDRFRIIFKQLRPLPVTFVDVKAIKQKEQVNVNWKVENEINIREYAVEKSANGVNFVKIGTVQASGITNYAYVDESPFAGINFYRIRSVGVAGEVGYSKIVKVSYEAEPMISIFPNPIKSDRKATISFKNVNAGRYTLKLTNNLGQVLMRKAIQHDGVTTQYDFTLSKSVLNGSYTLEIIGQDNKKTSLKILF